MRNDGDPAAAGGRRQPPVPTLVRLSSSRAGVPEGESVDLAAEVRAVHDHQGPPVGSVAFRVGPRLLGTAPLDAHGVARLGGIRLPSGVHAVTATYSGGPGYAGASSTPFPQAVVAPAVPVLVAVAVPTRTAEGVRLEAQLLDPVTGRLVEAAGGVVQFIAGVETVAQAPIVAGQASVVVAEVPEGALRVVFAGDGEHAPASGHLHWGDEP